MTTSASRPPTSTLPDAASLAMRLPSGALHVAGRSFDDGAGAWVTDPWTGAPLSPVVLADAARAELAVQAAADAFPSLRRTPSFARRRLLGEIARRLGDARDELAALITAEAGKPLALARIEVDRAVTTFGLGAEEATRLGGEVIPLDLGEATADVRGEWRRVPRGPVLAITPFNFPLNLVAHKVAPALACGAPVVLKPAPQTPLTALRLAEIVRDAGAPADALQVVPCANDVAERLVRDDRFAVLSFTGSDRVGWHLKAIAGRKVVLLELGGNAACIVHEDARDSVRVAASVCASAFGYSGQVCIKTQRLYLHRPIADRVLGEIVERARAVVPADPRLPTTTMACSIDEAAARRVEAWTNEARAAEGVTALTLGARERNRLGTSVLRVEGDGRGLKVVDEEIFGPVLSVFVYDTWSEALAKVNASRYGLQAGIFTDSLARVREAYDELEVGAVVVGDTPSLRVDAMPYGGARDSGLGREGVRYAIEAMCERKTLVVRG